MIKKILSFLIAVMMLFSFSLPSYFAKDNVSVVSESEDMTKAKARLSDVLTSAVNLLTSPEITTYTSESCEKLEQAVSEGYELYYNPDATTEQINAQAKKVEDALLNMEKQIDTDDVSYYLSTVIAQAELLAEYETNYTADSWAVFISALENALYVQSNGQSEEDFIAAADNLNCAMALLVPVDNAISDARAYLWSVMDRAYMLLDSGERFTAESLSRLEEALESANELYYSTTATADALNAEADNLENAMGSLERISISEGAFNYLADVLSMADTQVGPRENYTNASYNAFLNAYNNALSVFETGESDEEVIAAADALGFAINNLVSADAGIKTAREYLKSVMDSAFDVLSETVRYTEESKGNLESALEQANAVYVKENATESELHLEADKLENAINSMEEVVISKEASDYLSAQIERANTEVLTEENYTPESFRGFFEAYSRAVNVLGKGESDEEFYLAADALKNAIDSLVTIDFEKNSALEELSALIETAKEAEGNFTSESLEALKKAIDEATDVISSENPSLEEIKTQINALNNAIEGLEEIIVPSEIKEKLSDLIALSEEVIIPEDFYSDTWSDFSSALYNAKKIYNEEHPQEDYMKAYDSLEAAMDSLMAEVRDELSKLIYRGAPIGGNYTSESYSRLINALENAREVYDDENSSINEIVMHIRLVNSALMGLQITPISPTAKQTLWNVIEKSQIEVGEREDYTRESWDIYSEAYGDAMGTYYYGQSDTEYYMAAQMLQSAMDALVLLSDVPPSEPTPDEVYVLLGDVDGDNKVSVKDATFIQKCVAGLNTLETFGEFSADANRDGVVNIKDATEIQKHLAGLKSCEDIGKEVSVSVTVLCI